MEIIWREILNISHHHSIYKMDPQILSPASYGNRAPQKKKKPKKPSAELPSRHSTRSDENSGKIEPGTEHMSSGQRKNLKLLKSDERARVIDARAVLDSAQKHLATLLKNGGKGGDEDIDELIFNREAEIPVEPIRKGKCPFYFDQRIVSFFTWCQSGVDLRKLRECKRSFFWNLRMPNNFI